MICIVADKCQNRKTSLKTQWNLFNAKVSIERNTLSIYACVQSPKYSGEKGNFRALRWRQVLWLLLLTSLRRCLSVKVFNLMNFSGGSVQNLEP